MTMTLRALIALLAAARLAAATVDVIHEPRQRLIAQVLADGAPAVMCNQLAYGPKWAWWSLAERSKAAVPVSADLHCARDGQAAKLTYTAEVAADTPLTLVCVSLDFRRAAESKLVARLADGSSRPVALPIQRGELPPVSELELTCGDARIRIGIDPPTACTNDNGALRLALARNRLAAGAATVSLVVHEARLLDSEETLAPYRFTPGSDWQAFQPTGSQDGTAIAMDGWLDRPAGSRGRARIDGDRLVLPDGTPVRWWGTNVQFSDNCPAKAEAELHARRLAVWGVNCLRLHKFSGPGWEGFGSKTDATGWDPKGLDRFDYFTHRLAQEGVSYGFSHTFQFTVPEEDRGKVLAWNELIHDDKKGNAYALINVAEDVQDLMIAKVVYLLRHRNPHAGKTYAEDPALAYVELQNEDDIFFFTLDKALSRAPTYRARMERDFAAWLAKRYPDTAAWERAWAGGRQKADRWNEQIAVQTNPWMLGREGLPNDDGGKRQRLLDQAAFMDDLQKRFYRKFTAAVRAAGYDGPLIGSPWQAPTMLPHLYNLRNDAEVGIVDRHNYWGGWIRSLGSYLPSAAGGCLAAGMQQVAGRPFMLSEWNVNWPSMYGADLPVVIAAYGLGLQGWSGSFQFNSSTRKTAWSPTCMSLPHGVLEVDVPNQFGQYPVLSRMVQRGDVATGPVLTVRRVSDKALAKGRFDFDETVVQEGAAGDFKSFGGSVPQAALTVGRVQVEFTGAAETPSQLPDLANAGTGGVWRSLTGQLVWDTQRRMVGIATPGTQGAAGFIGGKPQEFADLRIASDSPYASILATAAGRKENLANCQTALVSAVARISQKGLVLSLLPGAKMDGVLAAGGSPVLCEPVRAALRWKRRPERVEALDHDGRRSGRTLTIAADGTVAIDTAADGGWLYEVTFKP